MERLPKSSPDCGPGRKKLLLISPHFPYPPTEGGMIRTYSLLRAFPPEWEIHYIVLHNSGRPMSKTCLDGFHSVFPNLSVEEYDRSVIVNLNLVEQFRAKGMFPRMIALRDKLKPLAIVRPVFWIMNLPFNLYSLIKKYRRVYRFVRHKLGSTSFDAVLLDYTKMAYLTPVIRNRKLIKILNVHNAESDLARQVMMTYEDGPQRRAAWLDWKLYQFYEKYFVPKFDLLLVVTPADAEFHRVHGRELRTIVFPNVVDTSALRPLPMPEEPFSLIYPGRLDYPPNTHAVSIFCDEILPRIAEAIPEARFYVVGKNPPASVRSLQSDRVVVTGYVDDVQPFWRKSAVLVVPLSVGGGSRIKILEAMALGRPVVSTSKGCEGLEVSHNTHLLIADDPDKFANYVTLLMQDSELYTRLTHAARKLVEEKYSFASFELPLREALETVMESR